MSWSFDASELTPSFGNQLVDALIGGGSLGAGTNGLLTTAVQTLAVSVFVIGFIVLGIHGGLYIVKSGSALKAGGDGGKRVHNVFAPLHIIIFVFLVIPFGDGYPAVVYAFKSAARLASDLGDNSAKRVESYFVNGHSIISPYVLQTGSVGKAIANASVCAAIANSIDGTDSIEMVRELANNSVLFKLSDSSGKNRCSYQFTYTFANATVAASFQQYMGSFQSYKSAYLSAYNVINPIQQTYYNLRENSLSDPQSLSDWITPENLKTIGASAASQLKSIYSQTVASAYQEIDSAMARIHSDANGQNGLPAYTNSSDGKDYNSSMGWIGLASRFWAVGSLSSRNMENSSIAISIQDQPFPSPNDINDDLTVAWNTLATSLYSYAKGLTDAESQQAANDAAQKTAAALQTQLVQLDSTALAQVVLGTSGKGLVTNSGTSGNDEALSPIKLDFGIDSSTYIDADGNIVGRFFAKIANMGQIMALGTVEHFINSDDPFLAIVDVGHYLMGTGEMIGYLQIPISSTAEVIAHTTDITEAAEGSFVSNFMKALPGAGLINKLADVAIQSTATMVAKAFSKLDTICLWMILVGAFMALYLPLIPTISWIEIVMLWLVTTAESCVLSILWPFVYLIELGSDTLAPQRSQLGFSMFITVLLLPLLCVVGYCMFVVLINPALKLGFLILSYSFIDSLMTSNVAGIPTFFAIVGITALVSYNIIQRLTEIQQEYILKAIKWIGGNIDIQAQRAENEIRRDFLNKRQDMQHKMGA
ncbi:hypothetical protein C4K68_09630 [Pokkaliibacter plantistimulans]|uniref:Uncharacterized protein n=1 Tax=Proteobacteria bacterium 228 TaxID=2083153 RepID=A0A2S5KSV5_9PROT|nr:DotA/TraY family protein [Pokkaliibacter plantistimulans]PPC77609.1 hypothetical protein C4K68_09630 [Pokkaliibacter plantistimulans]